MNVIEILYECAKYVIMTMHILFHHNLHTNGECGFIKQTGDIF